MDGKAGEAGIGAGSSFPFAALEAPATAPIKEGKSCHIRRHSKTERPRVTKSRRASSILHRRAKARVLRVWEADAQVQKHAD